MTKRPDRCLVCKSVEVKSPAVVCLDGIGSTAAIKAMRRYRRSRRPKGSVKAGVWRLAVIRQATIGGVLTEFITASLDAFVGSLLTGLCHDEFVGRNSNHRILGSLR